MWRILAFSFSWVLFTSHPLSETAIQTNLLLFRSLYILVSNFFQVDSLTEECLEVLSSVPLKAKTGVFLWKKCWYQWFRIGGHIQTLQYLKKKHQSQVGQFSGSPGFFAVPHSPSSDYCGDLGAPQAYSQEAVLSNHLHPLLQAAQKF